MSATANTLWGLDSPVMTINAGHMVFGMTEDVEIPLPPFLIQHDEGLILLDTGFNPCVCEDPALLFGDRPETDMIESKPEQALDKQLEMLGFTTDDVTHVVVSHLHCDHAGGLFLFPNAKFFIGPGELAYGKNPTDNSAHLVIQDDFLNDEVANFDWTVVDTPRHDLMGDGSIELLHLPGHTPGQLAMLVRLPSQTILLSSDVVHLREAYEQVLAAPTDADADVAIQSIHRMREIVEEENAKLWIAHDFRDWAEFGEPRTPIQ